MSEWISVKDRLPEKDQDILAYRSDGFIFLADFCGEFYMYSDASGYSTEENVTHWQPLPEPPKD